MRPQIHFLIFQSHILADILAVILYRFRREAQGNGELLGAFTMLDKIGDLDLGGTEAK